jgi:hypothetical protein
MLLLLTAVLGSVVVGLLVGGRLSGFEHIKLRWWGLAPLGLAMQLTPLTTRSALGIGLLLLSYVVLISFCLLNRRLSGFLLIAVGLGSNLLVIGLNGGMPVTTSALIKSGQPGVIRYLQTEGGAKHHIATDDVLLPIGDVIPIGTPFNQVVSIGDVMVYAGIAWFCIATMRRQRRGVEGEVEGNDGIPAEDSDSPSETLRSGPGSKPGLD